METIDTPAGPVPVMTEGSGSTGVLLATGAGTGQDHPGVAGLRSRLAEGGLRVMTFEYAYRAAGRRAPDPPQRLLAVHRAAAAHLRAMVGSRLVLAGRSMGGRMATMLAADDEPAAGVVVYGYPLHPPGLPDRLRTQHLGSITIPLLLISGTNDAFARPDLRTEHLGPLPTADLVLVEGADHSFRRKETSPSEMLDHLAALTVEWIHRLPGLGGGDGEGR